MANLSIANRQMLYSLSWYMTARQTELRAALSLRTPLSVTNQADMRVHYSGYFLNLLAATELFRETTTLQSNDFETQLYSRLVFDEFENGETNYPYIRELRNAIVHRGLDITSAQTSMAIFRCFLRNQKCKIRGEQRHTLPLTNTCCM